MKKKEKRKKGTRYFLLLRVFCPLFVNGSIQFSPTLPSFQRVLSALPRRVGNNILYFADLGWLLSYYVFLWYSLRPADFQVEQSTSLQVIE